MDGRPCTYYGRLDDKLLGDNVCVYAVDEAFIRLLEKHEERLIIRQNELLKELRSCYVKDLRAFKLKMDLLHQRLTDVETKQAKLQVENKEASSNTKMDDVSVKKAGKVSRVKKSCA